MKKTKILLILVTVFTLATGCKNKEKEEKQETKNETEVTQPIIAESFEFKVVSVNFENENSVFDINVKNTSNEERFINEFIIHVKDENGSDLAALFGYINETIEPNGERVISCSFGGNLSNYKSLEYEVTK